MEKLNQLKQQDLNSQEQNITKLLNSVNTIDVISDTKTIKIGGQGQTPWNINKLDKNVLATEVSILESSIHSQKNQYEMKITGTSSDAWDANATKVDADKAVKYYEDVLVLVQAKCSNQNLSALLAKINTLAPIYSLDLNSTNTNNKLRGNTAWALGRLLDTINMSIDKGLIDQTNQGRVLINVEINKAGATPGSAINVEKKEIEVEYPTQVKTKYFRNAQFYNSCVLKFSTIMSIDNIKSMMSGDQATVFNDLIGKKLFTTIDSNLNYKDFKDASSKEFEDNVKSITLGDLVWFSQGYGEKQTIVEKTTNTKYKAVPRTETQSDGLETISENSNTDVFGAYNETISKAALHERTSFYNDTFLAKYLVADGFQVQTIEKDDTSYPFMTTILKCRKGNEERDIRLIGSWDDYAKALISRKEKINNSDYSYEKNKDVFDTHLKVFRSNNKI